MSKSIRHLRFLGVRFHGTACATATSPKAAPPVVNIKESSKLATARIPPGPSLREFIRQGSGVSNAIDEEESDLVSNPEERIPYVPAIDGRGKKVFFEVYGCQMNVNDTEVVWTIMKNCNYSKTDTLEEADVILLMTCAIRDNAEQKVLKRLEELGSMKTRWRSYHPGDPNRQRPKIGVLGCMAERMKEQLLEKRRAVDVVCGPDAYRDLPRLLDHVQEGQKGINVLLSMDETYADITPLRLSENSHSAFLSIMRGCDNMCTYCIVPFTRGRERSRPMESIMDEVKHLADSGIKEITLLGQNVNSYRDLTKKGASSSAAELSPGFTTVYKTREGGLRFTELLDCVSNIAPDVRFRFTSPHPKDFPEPLIDLIASRHNICKQIHIPAQSGSSAVLERMGRGYTRESYLELIDRIRDRIPFVSLSSDFITGFCGETAVDHLETLDLVRKVGYDHAYLFAYSMREKTRAHRRLNDDVPADIKQRRLEELIRTFYASAKLTLSKRIGSYDLVLVEGDSKRNKNEFVGRGDGNHRIVFPKKPLPSGSLHSPLSSLGAKETADSEYSLLEPRVGDWIEVIITDCTSATLRAEPLAILRSPIDFYKNTERRYGYPTMDEIIRRSRTLSSFSSRMEDEAELN